MRHLLGLISLALVLASGAAQAAERINVVASFSILADMLREVDYTEAELTTLREASALMRRAVER